MMRDALLLSLHFCPLPFYFARALTRSRGGGRCSRSPSCAPSTRPRTPPSSTCCPPPPGSRRSRERTCSSSRPPSQPPRLRLFVVGVTLALCFYPGRRR